MGCFSALMDVPEQAAEFVPRQVELPEETLPLYRGERTAMSNFRRSSPLATRRMRTVITEDAAVVHEGRVRLLPGRGPELPLRWRR